MKSSPTVLSLRKMRKEGYNCAIVEKKIPKVFITKDLFGFIDILCVKGKEIIGIQTTTSDHVSHRKVKILEHENYPLIKDAIRIVIHGWRIKANKYVCREIELGKILEENSNKSSRRKESPPVK